MVCSVARLVRPRNAAANGVRIFVSVSKVPFKVRKHISSIANAFTEARTNIEPGATAFAATGVVHVRTISSNTVAYVRTVEEFVVEVSFHVEFTLCFSIQFFDKIEANTANKAPSRIAVAVGTEAVGVVDAT